MRLYLDSNVLISLTNHEFGGGFEYMEYRVGDFFAICAEDRHTIVVSKLFLIEVAKHTYLKENEVVPELERYGFKVELFTPDESNVRRRLKKMKGNKADFEETGTHYQDRIHIALALESGCDAIITWDKHFQAAKKLIMVLRPDEFD